MINNSLKTIILAAGESKRILSSKSKILHTIGGKAIIEHVLDNISKVVNKKNINVVISPKSVSYTHLTLPTNREV